ncbi:universal stress protein [Streptomyces spectabilis]|uniref:universal stress protein n=1 Tax=Streptomyces spectabilis TaxID=68270 RepID=UPI0018652F52|nr:universal stress protein [Streptomyces spectabilis]
MGIDGSEHSLRAVDWAADEAALHGAPLRLVYAASREDTHDTPLADVPGEPSAKELADFVVDTAARRAHRRDDSLKLSLQVMKDDPGARTAAREAQRPRPVLGHPTPGPQRLPGRTVGTSQGRFRRDSPVPLPYVGVSYDPLGTH